MTSEDDKLSFTEFLRKEKFIKGTADADVDIEESVDKIDTSVDEIIDKALNSNNQDEARKYWREVQKITAEDYPYLYIVNIEHSYFVSDDLDISVDTQIPHPHGHGAPIINNMNDWTLKR